MSQPAPLSHSRLFLFGKGYPSATSRNVSAFPSSPRLSLIVAAPIPILLEYKSLSLFLSSILRINSPLPKEELGENEDITRSRFRIIVYRSGHFLMKGETREEEKEEEEEEEER